MKSAFRRLQPGGELGQGERTAAYDGLQNRKRPMDPGGAESLGRLGLESPVLVFARATRSAFLGWNRFPQTERSMHRGLPRRQDVTRDERGGLSHCYGAGYHQPFGISGEDAWMA